jgi:hypothetical protein
MVKKQQSVDLEFFKTLKSLTNGLHDALDTVHNARRAKITIPTYAFNQVKVYADKILKLTDTADLGRGYADKVLTELRHTVALLAFGSMKKHRPVDEWISCDLIDRWIFAEGELNKIMATYAAGNTEELLPEVRAILFINERVKNTGKLPTKTSIAKILDVSTKTLNNWKAFKTTYAVLKAKQNRTLPKGKKDKDGNLEAWK